MVIVAAVSDSDEATDIAIEADALAQAFSEDVHIVHVVNESEYTRTVERQSESRETGTGDVAENAAQRVTDGFDDVLSVTYEVIGLVGNPGKQIVEYAAEIDARYIVIGGRTRSPVGKAFFGSVTQSVLLNTERPVLTLTSTE